MEAVGYLEGGSIDVAKRRACGAASDAAGKC